MRGDGRIFPRGAWLWVSYSLRGQEIRESAKGKDGKNTNDQATADKFLRARLKEVHADEIGARAFETPQSRRLTVGDLLDGLKSDYELRGKASPQNLSYIETARKDFGGQLAISITAEKIDQYIGEKLAEQYAPASVNRRLQMVSQAFALAVRRGTLSRVPFIRKLSEAGNARQGFFSEAEIDAVLENLPDDGLRDFVEWGAATGQRKSEIAALTWDMVQGNELHIPGTICKNGKARVIPLGTELATIIERRKKARRVLSLDGTAQLSETIFHRGDGQRVGDFKKSWATATRKANCTGKLFHDLRRSCARRLVAAGIPQVTARAFTGHLTDSVFSRYAIVSSADLLAAQTKVAEFRKAVAK
jgi:integrase